MILAKIKEELMIHYQKKSHLKRKQKTRRKKKALATGGASKFGGKNPFASRRQGISSDEDAADDGLEDGPITASNNTTSPTTTTTCACPAANMTGINKSKEDFIRFIKKASTDIKSDAHAEQYH